MKTQIAFELQAAQLIGEKVSVKFTNNPHNLFILQISIRLHFHGVTLLLQFYNFFAFKTQFEKINEYKMKCYGLCLCPIAIPNNGRNKIV